MKKLLLLILLLSSCTPTRYIYYSPTWELISETRIKRTNDFTELVKNKYLRVYIQNDGK